jgi:cytochrome c-type biogenesis protein
MKPFVAVLKRMRSRFALVERTMGGLLVLTGIAFLTAWITKMSLWLLETFPVLATLG